MPAEAARAGTVVRLRGHQPVTLDDGPKTVAFVQSEIWLAGGNFIKIATDAGVSISTVSNIASGTTRYPRLATIVRILMALGYRITASR